MDSDVAGCEAYAPGHGMPTVVLIPVFWPASIMTRTLNKYSDYWHESGVLNTLGIRDIWRPCQWKRLKNLSTWREK